MPSRVRRNRRANCRTRWMLWVEGRLCGRRRREAPRRWQLEEQHDLRDSEGLRVSDRQKRAVCLHIGESPGGASVEPQLRWSTGRAHDLYIAPEHALRVTGAERFHRRLFRRKPAREVRCRIPATSRVCDFSLGEDASEKAIAVSLDRGFDAINFGCVHSDPDNICRHVPSTA